MLKYILHTMIRRFERQHTYDATYMHEIIDISPRAMISLNKISGMANFVGPEKSVWAGAALAATLNEDCGPCAQLTLDSLEAHGIDLSKLEACL